MAEDNPQGGNPGEVLQKLLDKKNGDAMAVAMTLLSENFDLRQKNRDLRDKVPQDGSVVLGKEDAQEWATLHALGTASDVKKKVEAHDAVVSENSKLKRDGVLRSAADAGYSFNTLRDFDALEGQEIEDYVVREETKDGKAVKSVSVKVSGKERPLEEYAKEKRPALASIIRESGSQGTTYVSQTAGGTSPKGKDVYEQQREEVKQKYGQTGNASWQQRAGIVRP